MAVWQFHEAKARLSELARRAKSEGPQIITVHGKAEYVFLSKAEYDASRPPKKTLWEQFAPLRGTLDDVEIPDFSAHRREEPDRAPYFAEDEG